MSRFLKLSEAISFNPLERIKKGSVCKKISMENLRPFSKNISGCEKALYSGGTKFRNGDILVARITPCLENGKTAKVSILDNDEIAFGSTEFIVLRAKPGVSDPDYVYYLSVSPAFRSIAIKSMVGSSGRQRVQQNVLENSIFEFPDLPIQRKISSLLANLDAKIELNTQINQNLEKRAA